VQITNLYVPEKRKQTRQLTGTPADVARDLVKALRDDARVI
jgi:hypothetical protein